MSNLNDSIDFKVIKRIPLSKTISNKPVYDDKTSSRLKKMDVYLDKKEKKEVPTELKGVKKVDLKIDVSDVSENAKNFNPFKKSEIIKEFGEYFSEPENKKEEILISEKNINTPKENKSDFLSNKELDTEKKDYSLKNQLTIYNHSLSIVPSKEIISVENKHKLLDISNKSTQVVDVFKKNNLNKLKQSKIFSVSDTHSKVKVSEIDKSIKKEISIDPNIPDAKATTILKDILDNISNPSKSFDENHADDFYQAYKNKETDVDSLLDQLNKKANKLDEDVFLEAFSFLDDKPKVKKIDFSSYDVKNLYSKIDDITLKNKKEDLKQNNLDSSTKENQTLKKSKDDYNLFEEIDVPDIFAIEDDISNIDHVVEDKFTREESPVNPDSNLKVLNNDSEMFSTINTNEGRIEKVPNFVVEDNNVKLNKDIENSILKKPSKKQDENFNIDSFNRRMVEDQKDVQETLKKVNFSKEDDLKLQASISQIINSPEVIESKIVKKIKENPKVKKDLIAEKFKELREKGVDYILPKDAGKSSIKINKEIYQEQLSSDNSLFSSLVYNDKIVPFSKDITKVYDKYSIDDFTYVTIYYDQENGLFYNLVQPELSAEQEKEYIQIKKIFFNTIDKNYYSFNGDKHSLDNYIEKIYDISLDKLSYSLNNLQKKLYLKFIQREFFGLGILTNLLQDKKILEVSCSGEKSSLSVNHVEYGVLKTNISFPDISELNKFVLILTKNMGLYITQAHPVISGYLPNGYKVEGLYSIGDTSSKGSSFVIKKYLDEPLTPVSLINNSVGSIDVFSYIWSAISENYKIVLIDVDDSFVVFNSVLLFLPDKKIITVQAYDRFKLPHKDWINRVFTSNQDLNKKLMIEQTISQKPDYIVVDQFSKDVFQTSWYNLDLFSISPEISSEFIEQLKIVNQKTIIIELRKIDQGIKEVNQIITIKEIINKKENVIAEIDVEKGEYTINLLSSSINVVDFLKRKKLIKWMRDSKVYNYKDFNSLISQYTIEKDNLFKKLDIK